MTEQEEWRPIAGYPGYEVSSLGRVLSHKRPTPRFLRPTPTKNGYPSVALHRTGEKQRTFYVHQLVTAEFIGPRPDGMEVRHLNGDRQDCRASNLDYGTTSGNAYDRVRHGTHVNTRKTHCPRGHAYDAFNSGGARVCSTCRNAWQRAYNRRRSQALANINIDSTGIAA